MKKNEIPPHWAERLLGFYCRPELLEDLQGDLFQYFQKNVRKVGLRRAKLIYVIDVFKFFRLYTVRKPEWVNIFIQWVMIGSYIKTSGRSIVRNKLFSTINIIGLSVSMSVGLMMISILADVFSYDKFNEHHSRIVRVVTRYQFLDRKDDDFVATTSLKAGKAIEESISMPEAVAIVRRDFGGDLKASERTVPIRGFWTNPSFFKVFSFEMIKGNPVNALKEPFSIVLTETAVKKLFGNDDAFGKTVTLNNDRQYTITGIMKDVPAFSHIKFEMLGSLSTREILKKDDNREMAWDNVWNAWTYLLLPQDADLKSLEASLDELSIKEDPTVPNTHIEMNLQPLDDIILGESLGNQIGPVMGGVGLLIFGTLTLMVLLSAGFNYTNLSIARSLRRTREVGIRKVIGARKGHVMGQFIAEAIIISLCSLVLAFIIFLLLKPYFLGLEKDINALLRLELSPQIIVAFILFAVVIGIFAGFFPALFFAKIDALKVLKDLTGSGGSTKLIMRRVLIVFQYSISIIFITSTVIFYKQYRHFVSFNLGYNTENIINIQLQGNKSDILKKELEELPEVKAISKSSMVTSVGNYWGARMKYYANPDDSAGVYYNAVDEYYLPLHEHQLLAGRNFSFKNDSLAETEVIVNEQVLKRFNIGDGVPARALDEIVRVDRKDMRIIGVMKDFEYGRSNSRNSQKEVIFRYLSGNSPVLNVKFQSTDLLATYEKINDIWKKMDSIHPLHAKFYSDEIEETYSGFKAAIKVAGFIAALAICIATVGLLGMVVFTTEARMKEISIRKVMGASETGLMYLMGRGFFLLMVLAVCIAIPVTWLFFERVMFLEISNHLPISALDLLLGVAAVLLIAFLMIVSQTWKVARTNPAEVLKNE